MKTARLPSGETVWFDPVAHRYKVESTAQELCSVTTFIKSFFPPFSAQEIAERCAVKRGTTADALLAEWDRTRQSTARMGTRVHENCEFQLHGRTLPHSPENEHERAVMAAGWTAVDRLRGIWQFQQAEKIVFSPEMGLAGTIDLLMTAPDDRTLWILDWKTNREIVADKWWHMGFEPIGHLADCNLVHYALQLSTYEQILRRENYVRTGTSIRRALIHLTEQGPQWYELPDLGNDVARMVTWIHTKGWHDVPF